MTVTKLLKKQSNNTDYDTYESILFNLSKSKKAWLDLLQYNDINNIWQETLDYLLQSEADLHEWNYFWSGNIDSLIAEISDYRQFRIVKSHASLTLAEFKRHYRKDAKRALERLFVEPINDFIIQKFEAVGMDGSQIYELRINRKIERVHGSWTLM